MVIAGFVATAERLVHARSVIVRVEILRELVRPGAPGTSAKAPGREGYGGNAVRVKQKDNNVFPVPFVDVDQKRGPEPRGQSGIQLSIPISRGDGERG